MDFKKEFSFEKRKEESNRVITKFDNRIPLIIQRSNYCQNISKIDKRKYLVPYNLSLGQIIYVIRKRIKLDSSSALFIFINNKLLPTSSLIYNIYNEYKDEDGFLYIYYSSEETFG